MGAAGPMRLPPLEAVIPCDLCVLSYLRAFLASRGVQAPRVTVGRLDPEGSRASQESVA